MAQELKKLMRELTRLADNYCDNALKVVPSDDHAKLVDIYRAGLGAACAGFEQALGQHYDGAGREWRRQADQWVAATGAIEMLQAANKAIGKNSFENADALYEAGGIFDKAKKAISGIPGILQLVIPIIGGAGKLMEVIDYFIENIRHLFGSSDKPGGSTVSKPVVPPPEPNVILKPCEWVTLHDGAEAQFDIFCGNAPNLEVEVREDGKISPQRLEGFHRRYKGKKIEVHLRTGGSPSADVGYLQIK